MNGRWETCSADDSAAGLVEAYVVSPPSGMDGCSAPRGAVMLISEIFGVNEAMRSTADMFAAQGYTVILPDIFARQQRRVDLGYADDDRKKGFALMLGLDHAQAVEDCRVVADFVQRREGSDGKLAVVGFCIGGLLALKLAASHPCSAVASFYGVKVDENLDVLSQIDCPVAYHVGTLDLHIPPEKVALVQKAAAGMPNLAVYVYAQAAHGFFNPWREGVFAPEAFELAKARTFSLLERELR